MFSELIRRAFGIFDRTVEGEHDPAFDNYHVEPANIEVPDNIDDWEPNKQEDDDDEEDKKGNG